MKTYKVKLKGTTPLLQHRMTDEEQILLVPNKDYEELQKRVIELSYDVGYEKDESNSLRYQLRLEKNRVERLKSAIAECMDKSFLKDTSILTSNPAQNASVRNIQLILEKALKGET